MRQQKKVSDNNIYLSFNELQKKRKLKQTNKLNYTDT